MAEEFHKHKPKDIKPQGENSGLDADTVDGKHASELGGGGVAVISLGSSRVLLSQSSPGYYSIHGGTGGGEWAAQRRFPACTLKGFWVYTSQKGSANGVLTIRKNGSDTVLTITLNSDDPIPTLYASEHDVSLTKNDLICIGWTPVSGSGSWYVTFALDYT